MKLSAAVTGALLGAAATVAVIIATGMIEMLAASRRLDQEYGFYLVDPDVWAVLREAREITREAADGVG